MISEGSCDTEDWNDAENSASHHRNKLHLKHFQIENSYFKLQQYFTLLFLLYFWSNKCSFCEEKKKILLIYQKNIFQKHLKIITF